ncbi:hypothetical protein [Okeania sp. SIO2B3]|uniref:hypothetical protein n=1 Tax=Okeania sp. SIO2B3 TaxID=2607784 RepID=UPI0025FE9922|nr:hypothetical protein [Okeania sp. SIO2B3]
MKISCPCGQSQILIYAIVICVLCAMALRSKPGNIKNGGPKLARVIYPLVE